MLQLAILKLMIERNEKIRRLSSEKDAFAVFPIPPPNDSKPSI